MGPLFLEKPVFSGLNEERCDEFIQAIREYAFAQEKQNNSKWIAELAATCLKGDALLWHIGLDDNVQADWKLLQKALLQEYLLKPPPRAASR